MWKGKHKAELSDSAAAIGPISQSTLPVHGEKLERSEDDHSDCRCTFICRSFPRHFTALCSAAVYFQPAQRR